MPTKHPQFVNNEIYHIVLRGVASQKTFLEDRDYLRYLLSLYKFNDKKIVSNLFRNVPSWKFAWGNLPHKLPDSLRDNSRDLLVGILAVCLMPNHIHLLIRQLVDNGISLFFNKMGGYPSYFNKKYERFGSLFRRPFKAILIKTNDQLMIVVTYIHINPTDLIEPNWKTKGISNPKKVIEFLESYAWSSYPHYLGEENFSWLIDSEFLNKVFEGPGGFQGAVKNRILEKSNIPEFIKKHQKLFLE